MKRWLLVSCLVLISALGVLVPVGAQASAVAAVQLQSGKPVKADVSKHGQRITYTFAATAHKHVTFQVTNFNFSDGASPGSFTLYFYKPDSTSAYASNDFFDNGYYDFTPPLTGTWTVELVPDGASVGTMTLTFANDVPTKALVSATPVTTTIKFQGQDAGYTFAGAANQHVTFQVTNFNFSDGASPGSFTLYFYKPHSTSAYASNDFFDNGYYDFTPPLTGTWTVELVPDGASVGTMTLTFANDVPTKALVSATPVTTTIKFQGQDAGYTFAATAGAKRKFAVTKFNFTDGTSSGSFTLYFYEPGNTSPYTSNDFFGNGSFVVTPPLSGTWTVQLVPDGASVGSMTLTMT